MYTVRNMKTRLNFINEMQTDFLDILGKINLKGFNLHLTNLMRKEQGECKDKKKY